MGMIPAGTLEEALSLAKEYLNSDYLAYLMPAAATTLPMLRKTH